MGKISEDKMPMFLAMRNIFYGGEFSNWLNEQTMPASALKEFEEAEAFFMEETGFNPAEAEKDFIEHCKPGDDCHCSEKTEKTINKLFYERYANQFEETAGSLEDGKVTLYFFNKLTDQNVAASLDDNGELVVEVL